MCIACTSSAVSTISTISTRCSSAATARPAPPPPPTATTTPHRHHRHPPPPHTPPHTTTHHLHLSQCAPCAPPRQTHRDDVEPMPAGAKVGGERLAVQAHRHHLAERLQRKGHREEPPTGGQGSRRLGRRPHADGRAQSEGSAYPGGPAKTAADSAEAQAASQGAASRHSCLSTGHHFYPLELLGREHPFRVLEAQRILRHHTSHVNHDPDRCQQSAQGRGAAREARSAPAAADLARHDDTVGHDEHEHRPVEPRPAHAWWAGVGRLFLSGSAPAAAPPGRHAHTHV